MKKENFFCIYDHRDSSVHISGTKGREQRHTGFRLQVRVKGKVAF